MPQRLLSSLDATNIHLKCLIEDNARIFRTLSTPIPPIKTKPVEAKTSPHKTPPVTENRLNTSKGINFWVVDKRKTSPHGAVANTLKNHIWNGASPNFKAIAAMPAKLAAPTPNPSTSTADIKNQTDPTL